MSKAIMILLALTLGGCAMSPAQKKWTGIAAGVLVVGAIAAHRADSGAPIEPEKKGSTMPACQSQKSC